MVWTNGLHRVWLIVFVHCIFVWGLWLQLPSIGINPQFITFTHVTMESEKYICVRETSPQNSCVIIDMNMPMQPLRRPITADSALMHPNTRILALKGRNFIFLPSFLVYSGRILLHRKCHDYSKPAMVFGRWNSRMIKITTLPCLRFSTCTL